MVDARACKKGGADLKQTVVMGFREEPRPKGHGYLYWRPQSGGVERVAADCDLYDLREAVVAPLLDSALASMRRELGEAVELSIATENMSAEAKKLVAKWCQSKNLLT